MNNEAKKPLVYVAGPYTQGNLDENIRRACTAGDFLWAYGCAPFVPHLFHLWELISPKPYDEWLELDFDMLERCDAMIRIVGDSPGADKEEEYCEVLGIPVFSLEFQPAGPDAPRHHNGNIDVGIEFFEWLETLQNA